MTPTTGAPTRSPRGRISEVLRRPYTVDLGLCLFFVALAGWLTHGLWPDPATRALALNPTDQALYEWFLAYDSRILFGDFSLVTGRLNAPDGVNLMVNTSVVALGTLLSPITVGLGAPVTFALIVAGNLALTAIAWYLLFTRTFGAHRAAAAVGAGFCGFAPAMVSQSNSHLHMTAQWLVPAIVWCVVRLARAADPAHPDHHGGPRRVLPPALLLAGLVIVQAFIGEEVLFLTAVTLLLAGLGYALIRPRDAYRRAPRLLGGLLLAAVVASAALAYPLWLQFAGPQHVPNGVFSATYFSADLASFPRFSPLSVAGTRSSSRLTTGPAEYNTFLGWPLLLVAAGLIWWLRRTALVWPLTIAALVMTWLSLGPQIVINTERTGRQGLFAILEGLPVVEAALPMRFAIALVPLLGALIAGALDRAFRQAAGTRGIIVAVAVALALVPLVPTELPTVKRAKVPAFITNQTWRQCVPEGGVLVLVPSATPNEPDPMRWATAAGAAFGIPEGFFIAPYAAGGQASVGTFAQPISNLLREVARTGNVPPVGDAEREQARRDLAFWKADCVALAEGTQHAEPLRTTLEALLGPGQRLDDVWVWKVSG